MTTTEENPLQLSKQQDDEAESVDSSEPSTTNINMTYIIVAVGLITLIIIAVYYLYRKSQLDTKSQLEEMSEKYIKLKEHNDSLETELQQLQTDNANYVQHIDRLAAQLEHQQVFSSITPMTEDSYDAPDPNAVQQKPQIIKDKEAIKHMVNSKRETVQDEFDRHKQQKDTTNENVEKQTQNELKEMLNIEDDQPSPPDSNEHDDNVETLMNIIQAQNDNK